MRRQNLINNMTNLVTVSDDRSGRKGGLYEATQRKIWDIFLRNDFVDTYVLYKICEVIDSEFGFNNKVMLDNIDAARNGRVYKPYVIKTELAKLADGDFLIYNDCSPEIWKMGSGFNIDKYIYDIEVIKNLTIQNRDFLVSFVKWEHENFDSNPLGIHTHHYFTLEPCIKYMNGESYRHSYQCASGMICIRKTPETVALVDNWLHYNRIPECACIGWPDVPDDETFWENREPWKLGIRHDQSILSMLLNQNNWDYVDIVYNDISPYNFLNFCRKDVDYKFINSNIKL